ncbi:MAG: sulfur carrier protein ThiS [Planctomycetes bacterium]|nr:sulfur carrier protein ThiS [Planctomycetota bacterium]MCH8120581.1 sulfur carrier protein ThiS [Planctomycetota bacterium]
MNLVVNGKETNITDGLTVSQLLVQENVKMPDMVSVELNGQILKRTKFEETTLKDDDKVEFIYFMGGGSVVN